MVITLLLPFRVSDGPQHPSNSVLPVCDPGVALNKIEEALTIG